MDKTELRKKREEYEVNKILKKYGSVDCVKILNVYEKFEISKDMLGALNEIIKIDYPVSFTKTEGDKAYRYIEYLYIELGLKHDIYRWLIPEFCGKTKWFEIVVYNMCDFFELYLEGNELNDFIAFDLDNGILFDVMSGEKDYEYYVKSVS